MADDTLVLRALRALAGVVALVAGLTSAALVAQVSPPVPNISPIKVEMDSNGVNITTGRSTLATPVMSIPAAPRLRFDWVQNWAPYVFGRTGANGGDGRVQANFSVNTGTGRSESFKCNDYDCSALPAGTPSGSVFTATPPAEQGERTLLQAGSGAYFTFNQRSIEDSLGRPYSKYYASSIQYPDGEVLTITYDRVPNPGIDKMAHRPRRVTSNLGFYIRIDYQGDVVGTYEWSRVRQASIHANADTAASTPLARLTFAGGPTSLTITDLAGREYTCVGCVNQLEQQLETTSGSLRLPTESSSAFQVSAVGGMFADAVASVTSDGVSYAYAYSNKRQPMCGSTFDGTAFDQVTVTGPNGYRMIYDMNPLACDPASIRAITDSLGRITSYTYDRLGRPITMTLPEGNKTSLTYDAYSNIVAKEVRAKNGVDSITERTVVNTLSCDMNPSVLCYRPTAFIDALGRQTDLAYDGRGMLVAQLEPADANGQRRRTVIEYAPGLARRAAVQVCTVHASTGATTCGTAAAFKTTYTYWGNTFLPLTETRVDQGNPSAGAQQVTTYEYDPAGQLLSVDGPLPGADDAVYYRYDAAGRRTWEIAAKGASGLRQAKRTTYRNADDKVVAVETGHVSSPTSTDLVPLVRTDATYDARRNPVRETASGGGTVQAVSDRSFDDRRRLVCVAERLNPATFASPAIDACSLSTAGTFGPDRITRNTYDAASALLVVTKALGTPLQQDYATYTYSANGKRLSFRDANGNLATFGYDGFDRQSSWTFPDGTYEAYGYDAAGNRTSLRKRDGGTILFTYDAVGRLILKQAPASAAGAAAYTVHYGYDVGDRQLFARFGSPTGPGTSNTYDALGRLATSTSTVGGTERTLSYQVDIAGRRTRLTFPDGVFFGYEHDAAGKLLAVRENGGAAVASFSYDAVGRRVGASVGGATSAFTYDGASRLSTLRHDLAGTSSDLLSTFGYNPASQITTRTVDNDAYAWTGHVNVNRPYAVNGLNQYTAAGAATFAYDANGNLTSDGSVSYVFDVENRLVSASGAKVAALSYDPQGRLLEVSGGAGGLRRFLYDGDELVAEYNAGGAVVRRYVHGVGTDDPVLWYEGAGLADRRSLFADHQGSVVAVASADGAALAINSYDAYGIPGWGNLGRFGYTGQAWLPEVGLWYYKARVYSPTLGRFLQTDPVGYDDQANLYAYVGNDPVNSTDPSGRTQDSTNEQIVVTARPYIPIAVVVPGTSENRAWTQNTNDLIERFKDLFSSWWQNRLNNESSEPPADAENPNGAKAPGKPGEREGFTEPKKGPKWGRAPNGKFGWVDDKGRVWVPTGPEGSRGAHGGPHWDVQLPGGGYTNVYPGGKER